MIISIDFLDFLLYLLILGGIGSFQENNLDFFFTFYPSATTKLNKRWISR